ncbi:MAG: hypothetical protein NW201_13740 [Gemmatimonadales bacterium]|nr:hypothetical protein [Gemmatimonadales bacterium]
MAGLLATLACGATSLAAQGHGHAAGHVHGDSAFHALEARGTPVMGVDQRTATHTFDDLPDGGRIALEAAPGDSAGVAGIRAHFAEIAMRFAAGDFTLPGLVHAEAVPGVDVLAARRARLRYERQELPRGAALRVRTSDPEALRALHRFLAYQRAEHRAGGRGPG